MTDYNALIAEAVEYDEWDVRAEPVSNTLDLLARLAAALRELAPPGCVPRMHE